MRTATRAQPGRRRRRPSTCSTRCRGPGPAGTRHAQPLQLSLPLSSRSSPPPKRLVLRCGASGSSISAAPLGRPSRTPTPSRRACERVERREPWQALERAGRHRRLKRVVGRTACHQSPGTQCCGGQLQKLLLLLALLLFALARSVLVLIAPLCMRCQSRILYHHHHRLQLQRMSQRRQPPYRSYHLQHHQEQSASSQTRHRVQTDMRCQS